MNPKIKEAFEQQAISCASLGSKFTARVCMAFSENLDTGTKLGQIIDNWPGDPTISGDIVPLRLCGALHALVLDSRDDVLAAAFPDKFYKWSDDALCSAIQQALITHEDFFISRLDSAPQTNEVRRCNALVPGILEITNHFNWPLILSEIGSSAGLNLVWEKYRYNFGGKSWGPEQSTVHLKPEWTGPSPHIDQLEILSREGCDLNPLDMTRIEDQTRLLSYIWPDQIERIELAKKAIAIAQANAPKIAKSNAADWLKHRLATHHENAIHIVYHSIMWQYMPAAAQKKCHDLLEQAGSKASNNSPLAWLRMEADKEEDGAGIYLTLWPDGNTHLIGRADFHGRWIKWIGL